MVVLSYICRQDGAHKTQNLPQFIHPVVYLVYNVSLLLRCVIDKLYIKGYYSSVFRRSSVANRINLHAITVYFLFARSL
jgi:hypothetical protein